MPTEEDVYAIEVLDGEVVPQTDRQLEQLGTEPLPHAADAARGADRGGGSDRLCRGAATMALLRRYGQARLERAAPAPALEPQRSGQARTFVVHVRQLG